MPIEIRGLCPLIQVFDMPGAIRFYRDVLEFEVVSTAPKLSDDADDVNWVLLRWSGAELMLNTAYDPEDKPAEPDTARFASHDDTCFYFGCPDVDGAYHHLLGKGLDIKPPKVAPYGMKQLYLKDPDGHGVCFQWEA